MSEKDLLARLERAEAELKQAREEQERTAKELAAANTIIRRARNPEPVERPSWLRTIRLVHSVCMNLERIKGGFLLSMGSLKRRFRTLKEIWEILSQDEWSLAEVLPPGKEQPRLVRPRRPALYPSLAPPASAFFSKNLAPPDAWGWS